MKKILFIAEKTLLNSSIAYSNDVNLLLSSLKRDDAIIYITNPEDLILSINKEFINCQIIKINDWQKINNIKNDSYFKSALFMLFSLSIPKELKFASALNKYISIEEDKKIKKSQIDIIIDRSEPISRTDQYYRAAKKLFNLNNNYFDNPIFRENEGDKEIVVKIDQELSDKKQKTLGFETINLDFSNDNRALTYENRHKLLRIFQTLDEDDDNLSQITDKILRNFGNLDNSEKLAIINIIKKIYHCQINFEYFCLKPSNWYGGVAIELLGNKKKKITEQYSQIKLFHLISKINHNILLDVQKNISDPNLILKNAILDGVIIQEQVLYPEFGDLRIFTSFGKIQGLISRVPVKDETIANMAAGGHAEMFINLVNKNIQEIDILEKELRKLGYDKIFDAIKALLQNVKNSLATNIGQNIKKSAFIGFDALLDEKDGKKYFACNEINLSSAMGQNQIEIANLLEDLLKNTNFCHILGDIIGKIEISEDIPFMLEKFDKFISPYVKFLIFQELIENLSDELKFNLIAELHLQISNINFNIINISNYTINKIING